MRKVHVFIAGAVLNLLFNITAGLLDRHTAIRITPWGWLYFFLHATYLLVSSDWFKKRAIGFRALYGRRAEMSYIFVVFLSAALGILYWYGINKAYARMFASSPAASASEASQALTGFVQVAGFKILNSTLVANAPLSINVGFIANGSQPISSLYLFQQAIIADYRENPDQQTERESEEYIRNKFNEGIVEQEKLIADQKLNGLTMGVGSEILFRTLNTAPLTEKQVAGLLSGQSRLYLATWTKWRDSNGQPGKLTTCNWLQALSSPDLSKQQIVWHLCMWW